ncbi:MAG: aspartate aminotransferase family protein [Euryarchaeota archaeon]|nr:aspartate aminotransferase family protein [Euryarchaeota archaeon]
MGAVGRRAKEETVEMFRRHVSWGKAEMLRAFGLDLVVGRREGTCLWDVEGKRLLDFHCNGGVFSLGHRNPRVLGALRMALEELDIGNHHLISEHRAELAEMLHRVTPGHLDYTVFGVGGGEAVDLAIKVARAHTRRPGIISARGGYHGHTGLALAAGEPRYREPFGPLAPGFTQVPFGDAGALEEAMGEDTAAVLLETIPATLGIAIPPPDYFPRVRELCDRHGALLVVDEVQSGLGRTGRVWAIEHYGVAPDILVTGKGLSGGLYPISATCLRGELERVFRRDPFLHISTFGGSEVGCRVALAVLDETCRPAFLEHVQAMGGLLGRGLHATREAHPRVFEEVRRLGLMTGLRFASPQHGPRMSRLCYDEGILALYANHDPRVLQFLPPLVIQPPEAEEALEALGRAVEKLSRKP